jgi:hypothetical protein
MVERTQLKFYTPDEVADLPEEGDPSIKPGDKFKRKAAFAAIALAGLDVNQVYYHIEEIPTHIPIATTIVTPAGKLSDVFNLGELATPPEEIPPTTHSNPLEELKDCIWCAKEYIQSSKDRSPNASCALNSLIRATEIVDQISRRF